MDDLAQRAQRMRAWLFDEALPFWAANGLNPCGGFQESLDADLRAPATTRFRVHARQTYVFAEAGRLGWQGPWREIVGHGLAFLIHRARRDDGLVAATFDTSGAMVDGEANLYDQAFALLGFAHAYAVLGDPGALQAARTVLAVLEPYTHPLGGFRQLSGPELKSNPQMHLLEAALAWAEIDDDSAWRRLADDQAALCRSRLVDAGSAVLREHFIGDWRPAPAPHGDLTEPGHHYEWAWLLKRANAGGDLSLRLAERAERFGVDRSTGATINTFDADGSPRDGEARLWPQTERLKAALSLRGEDPELWTARACEAFDALFAYIAPAPSGLWYDLMEQGGAVRPEAAPASSLYHIVAAASELIRAVE